METLTISRFGETLEAKQTPWMVAATITLTDRRDEGDDIGGRSIELSRSQARELGEWLIELSEGPPWK